MGRPARLAIALIASVLAVVAGAMGSHLVHAHSGLAAASPGPGATVGGTVDRIQIFYGDIITTFDATLTLQSSGEQIAGTAEMLSDIEAVIALDEPLSVDGEYAVRHTITSFDGDVVEAAYLFSYEADAAPPRLIFVEEEDDDGGTSPIVWIVAGVGAAVIVVLAIRLIVAIRRRQAAVSPPSDG